MKTIKIITWSCKIIYSRLTYIIININKSKGVIEYNIFIPISLFKKY